MNKEFFTQTKALLRYLEFNNSISTNYFNKVMYNINYLKSDYINMYVYKQLLNILKDKPYIKPFGIEYKLYFEEFENLQKKNIYRI